MNQRLISPLRQDLRLGSTAGVLGPVLFAACFLLQNLLRSDDDAVAEPVSALSIGEHGWVQRLNFVVFGLLLLVFVAALHRGVAPCRLGWVGPVLLTVAGGGLFVAATFPLARDGSGVVYDPSIHQVGGSMFFGGTALGLIALSRRLARDAAWRDLSRYVLVAGIASVAGGVLMNALAIPEDGPLHDGVGLLQRFIVLVIVFPALTALGLRLRRVADRPRDGGQPTDSNRRARGGEPA